MRSVKEFFDPRGSKLKTGAYIALGATTAASFIGWNVFAAAGTVAAEATVDYLRHHASWALWSLTNLTTQQSANVLATDTTIAAAVPSIAVLVAGGINSLRNGRYTQVQPLNMNVNVNPDETDPLLRQGNPLHLSKSASAKPQFSELLSGFMSQFGYESDLFNENRIYKEGAADKDYYNFDNAAGTLTDPQGKVFKINKDFELVEQVQNETLTMK